MSNPMGDINSMINSMVSSHCNMFGGLDMMGRRGRQNQLMPFGFPNMNDIFESFVSVEVNFFIHCFILTYIILSSKWIRTTQTVIRSVRARSWLCPAARTDGRKCTKRRSQPGPLRAESARRRSQFAIPELARRRWPLATISETGPTSWRESRTFIRDGRKKDRSSLI